MSVSPYLNDVYLNSLKDDTHVKIYKSMCFIRNMLTHRKYTVPDIDYDAIDFTHPSSINFTSQKKDDIVFIYYIFSESVSTDCAKNFISYVESHAIKHAIIVAKSKIAPKALETIKKLAVQFINVEIFYLNELQFDLTQHAYVPTHIICSKETKETVLKMYMVRAMQLPKILVSDAVCKWIGGQPGQLIKILRENQFAKVTGKTLYDISYRLVIENPKSIKGGVEKRKKKN